MVPSGVDLVKAFFDAYNARDVATVEELLDPRAEITTLSQRKGLAAGWGSRAATRRYFELLDEAWTELRVELHDVREVGGGLVATGLMRGVGKASEVEVVETIATVFVVRGSRFVVVDTYSDPEEALAAAGAVPMPTESTRTA